MARFVKNYPIKKSAAEIQKIVSDFMTSEGFRQLSYKGETVWKKGMGMLVSPQFLKFSIADNNLKLEAWIKWALLPGIYLGELGIDGFVGIIPKNLLRNRIVQIEKLMA